jgi:hypothetical protein
MRCVVTRHKPVIYCKIVSCLQHVACFDSQTVVVQLITEVGVFFFKTQRLLSCAVELNEKNAI